MGKVIPSECIAVVLEYVDTDVFQYNTALFQPMKLEGYDSIYWWTKEFLGQKYLDFDSAKTQAMKFYHKQDIPLLWGVAHQENPIALVRIHTTKMVLPVVLIGTS